MAVGSLSSVELIDILNKYRKLFALALAKPALTAESKRFWASLFKKTFCLFIHEGHRERGRDTGRGRSRLPTGSPMWDSIPGPQTPRSGPEPKTDAQPLSHPGVPLPVFKGM